MSDQVMFVVDVRAELLPGGQVQVRAELLDGVQLQVNRTDEDLAWMMKRLVDGFPDDQETLSCSLLPGLLRVRAADQSSDLQVKVVEVNRLLKTIITLPPQFSQSDAVMGFFLGREENRVLGCEEEEDHPSGQEGVQTLDQQEEQVQSPVVLPGRCLRTSSGLDPGLGTGLDPGLGCGLDPGLGTGLGTGLDPGLDPGQDTGLGSGLDPGLGSGLDPGLGTGLDHGLGSGLGFCLANTETILFDLTPPTHSSIIQSEDSTERRVSVGAAICLQLCRPSVSPHLRGFTGRMGQLVKRRSFRHRAAPPP